MTLTPFSDYSELFRNCVGYWDGSLNSAGNLQDIIGSNHGTISGATKTESDRFGIINKCYTNANNNQVITIPLAAEPTGAKTICVWLKTRNTTYGNSEQGGYIYDSGTWSSSYRGTGISLRDTGKIGIYIGSASSIASFFSNASTYLDGLWHLIVFTSVGDTTTNGLKLYIDGIFSIASTGASGIGGAVSHNIYLGNPYYTSYPNAPILSPWGELIIYNRVLTSEEIKQIYNLTKIKYVYPLLSGIRGVE